MGALLRGFCSHQAPPRETAGCKLDYRVYFGRVYGAKLGLTVKFDTAAYDSDAAAYDLRATAYAVQVKLKTTGLAKVARWKATAYSRGTLLSGEVVPVRAGYRSRQWTRKRLVELGFDEGTPKLVRMKPRKKSKVPPSQLKGALDPAGALLAVLSRVDAGRVCDLRIPVFDGRRLYELVGETDGDGAGRLRADRYSPFAGPTVDCRVRLEKKAGFKRKSGDAGKRERHPEMRLRMGTRVRRSAAGAGPLRRRHPLRLRGGVPPPGQADRRRLEAGAAPPPRQETPALGVCPSNQNGVLRLRSADLATLRTNGCVRLFRSS